MDGIISLFEQYTGNRCQDCVPLPKSGSNRKYFRLTDATGFSAIGTEGEDVSENRSFIALSEHLASKGIAVPRILAVDRDCTSYIQTDLGDTSLYDMLALSRKSGRYGEGDRELLRKVICCLPAIAVKGAEGYDFGSACFDRRSVFFDLNYFKYSYLKLTGAVFDERRLEDDFCTLADMLLSADGNFFLYRDFQARNVMICDGMPYFIDYQGARRGPLQYDLASFVWQARAGYDEDLKRSLVDAYLDTLSEFADVERLRFKAVLRVFVLFRTLQVLGAYGYRGLFERKEHFMESIPFALRNLRSVLDKDFLGVPVSDLDACEDCDIEGRLPYLCSLIEAITPEKSALVVDVCSFSYKKGLPEDPSGNGGGYVFDCRGILNPGRYEEYRQLDGRDREVIEFLEGRTSVARFLEGAFVMADMHIEDFISRGFTHLSISFGCTGGQHRSVYCAERMAVHIRDRYGVRVHLVHREMGETVDL